jgi:3-dehydroquinate synthase
VGRPVTTIEVRVSRPYDVLVGSAVVEDVARMIEERVVAVISDSHVSPLYAGLLCDRLGEAGKDAHLIEVPAGEDSKSMGVLGTILRSLAQADFGRDAAVLSLGGGMVSDLAGFAASCYMRGLSFYSCPTSLLAMVDASVGGKTGVNLPEGKNLVGAFWQPRLVLVDVATLVTLPARTFREGAVELFKHGLLDDPFLLGALDDPEFRPGGNPERLEEYVARSVIVKAKVVQDDERESGDRACLNLGHTLAHALEAVSDHRLSHGDSVAYGLLYAALLGAGRGLFDFSGEASRLLEWVRPAPLPCREFDRLLPFMLRDKKNLGSRQRFVLLLEQGLPVLVDDVGEAEQRNAWGRLLEVLKA